jgi:hypothetical protein
MRITSLLFLWSLYCSIGNSTISAQPLLGWASVAGGGNNDRGFGIVTSADGSVYSMGTYLDTVIFQAGSGEFLIPGSEQSNNTYIEKFSPEGNLIWASGFSGFGSGGLTGKKIAVDSNGNILLLSFFFGTVDVDPGPGTFYLTAVPEYRNYCIISSDESGNFLWARNILQVGEYNDVESLIISSEGDIFIAGGFSNSTDFDSGENTFPITSAGDADAFVLKLDPLGDFVWVKTFGSAGLDKVPALCLDQQNNVFVSGWFFGSVDFDPGPAISELTSESGSFNLFLLKLSGDGDFVWVSHFTKTDDVFVRDIASDQLGNIYVIGDLYGVVDFDPGAGVSELTSAGASDVCVVKYSNSGTFLWARAVGGSNYEFPAGITTNSDGELFCCGSFRGNADFDPGQGVYELNSADGWDDIFILKLSDAGNLIWVAKTGGPGNNQERCWDVCTTNSDEVYFTGQFRDVGMFSPGSSQAGYSSNGLEDSFVVKWLDTPSSTKDISRETGFSIYPNPANDVLFFKNSGSPSNQCFEIIIYDLLGRPVRKYPSDILKTGSTLDLSGISSGNYLIVLKDVLNDSRIKTLRLVIE